MPKLVFAGKDFAGKVHDLGLERTTVGRGPSNALVIHDKSVSEHHCEILVSGTEVIVRDLNSTNGTFVDGLRAAHQLPVKAGQVVRFGSVEARLAFEEPELTPSDEGATSVTAIHAFRKYVSAPQPAPPLDHDSIAPISGNADTSSQTMQVNRPAASAPVAVTPGPLPPAPKRSWVGTVWIGLAVLIIVALAWWLLRGR